MYGFISPDGSVIRYDNDAARCPPGWTVLPVREVGAAVPVGQIAEPGPVTVGETEIVRQWEARLETDAERVARLARPVSRLAFNLLLTQPERIAIRGSADPVVVDFLDLLSMASEVVLSDPLTQAGVQHLEDAGLLASGRAAEILAGVPPT